MAISWNINLEAEVLYEFAHIVKKLIITEPVID
jgi:hypothetical protein